MADITSRMIIAGGSMPTSSWPKTCYCITWKVKGQCAGCCRPLCTRADWGTTWKLYLNQFGGCDKGVDTYKVQIRQTFDMWQHINGVSVGIPVLALTRYWQNCKSLDLAIEGEHLPREVTYQPENVGGRTPLHWLVNMGGIAAWPDVCADEGKPSSN